MKKYEYPELEILNVEVEDVITTSGGGDMGEEELPFG